MSRYTMSRQVETSITNDTNKSTENSTSPASKKQVGLIIFVDKTRYYELLILKLILAVGYLQN